MNDFIEKKFWGAEQCHGDHAGHGPDWRRVNRLLPVCRVFLFVSVSLLRDPVSPSFKVCPQRNYLELLRYNWCDLLLELPPCWNNETLTVKFHAGEWGYLGGRGLGILTADALESVYVNDSDLLRPQNLRIRFSTQLSVPTIQTPLCTLEQTRPFMRAICRWHRKQCGFYTSCGFLSLQKPVMFSSSFEFLI